MKVLLSGYYGFGNVGDEAVLQAIIQGLRGQYPRIEITVLSAAPKLTAEFNQVRSVHRYHPLAVFWEMIKTDVLISGGGTLFQNVTSNRSLLYYLLLVYIAKLFQKKVIVFAQGFGPLNGVFYRRLTRRILNKVDLITLRDQESQDEIRNLGVKKPPIYVTADPTVILKLPPQDEGKRLLSLEGISFERPLLGIAVRRIVKGRDSELVKALAEAIDWLSESYNYATVFLLFECPDDMAETAKVISNLRHKSNVVFRVCRPDEMLAIISCFDLLIGMRLHALIFAAINNVPILGLSYDPKVEAFMKSIEQPCFKIDGDLNGRVLIEALDKIIKEKVFIRSFLKEKKKELFNKAKEAFQLFMRYAR